MKEHKGAVLADPQMLVQPPPAAAVISVRHEKIVFISRRVLKEFLLACGYDLDAIAPHVLGELWLFATPVEPIIDGGDLALFVEDDGSNERQCREAGAYAKLEDLIGFFGRCCAEQKEIMSKINRALVVPIVGDRTEISLEYVHA